MMKKTIFSLLLVVLSLNTFAQKNDTIIMQALKDELARNLKEIKLDGLQPPFYIAYTLADVELGYIEASLGSITDSRTQVIRSQNTNLLVGDYQRANNNYLDANILWRWPARQSIPLDDSYYGIRRTFWKSTDNEYKSAAEIFEAKLSAISNQNIPKEELDMPDYSKSDKISIYKERNAQKIDMGKWEKICREVSEIFKKYPDIHNSQVILYFYNSQIFFRNSEQSEASYPLTYAAIRITAETQAIDGEALFDHIHFYATQVDNLPGIDVLKKETSFLAETLVKLRNAPVFNEYYAGPVLVENQAVTEYFFQQVFSGANSLLDKRKPILRNEQIAAMAGDAALANRLEMRTNRRIMDRSITITSNPLLADYQGVKLWGHYPVDAEGVIPKGETVLVDEGILKSLISNRTPTKSSAQSNAGQRIALRGTSFSEKLAPGVIKVQSSNTMTKDKLKAELIKIAKDEDLDFAIIIRKFAYDVSELPGNTSGRDSGPKKISKPIYIYKVNLKDGSEELVRSAEVEGLNIRSLNRIQATSDVVMVDNCLLRELSAFRTGKGFFHGIPVSIITPDGILFKEVEVQKESGTQSLRLPIVDSPLRK